jgi:hypothetical protein
VIRTINGKKYKIEPKADLRGADLSEANLTGADLTGANLTEAYLSEANLTGANLRGANLRGANLTEAYLSEANLTGANLRGVYLTGANLTGADLTGATLPHFQICPEVESFYAWKGLAEGKVALLQIPTSAKRTSSLVGRKCRAEEAKVIQLFKQGEKIEDKAGAGLFQNTIYIVGKTTKADSFDPDIRVECSHGIHFFMTRKEAEEWAEK